MVESLADALELCLPHLYATGNAVESASDLRDFLQLQRNIHVLYNMVSLQTILRFDASRASGQGSPLF